MTDGVGPPMTVGVGPAAASGRVVLAILAFDGVLSALAGALLLPVRLATVPVPLSALLSGLLNAALVWAASHYTTSARLAALPLWTWLATIAVLTLGGPGGDVVFGGSGILGYAVLVLLVLGALPPVWVLRRLTV